jgi:hypothetical protein
MEDAPPVLQKLLINPTFLITDSDEEDEEQRRVAEEIMLTRQPPILTLISDDFQVAELAKGRGPKESGASEYREWRANMVERISGKE